MQMKKSLLLFLDEMLELEDREIDLNRGFCIGGLKVVCAYPHS